MVQLEGRIPTFEELKKFLVDVKVRKTHCDVTVKSDINNHPLDECKDCKIYNKEIPPEIMELLKEPEKCGCLLIYKTILASAAATLSRHK